MSRNRNPTTLRKVSPFSTSISVSAGTSGVISRGIDHIIQHRQITPVGREEWLHALQPLKTARIDPANAVRSAINKA